MRSIFCCLRLPISFDPGRLTSDLSRLHCSVERREDGFDVPDHRRGDRPVAVELGRRDVDLHNPRLLGPQRRPAMRQQPIEARPGEQHDIGVADRIRAGSGGRLRMVVGQQALGHRHRQKRHARRLDKRPDLLVCARVGGALTEDHERALGIRQQFEGAPHRLWCRRLRRRRIDDLDQRLLRRLRVERRAEHLGRQVEIDPARAPRDGGADRPRDADADVLWAVYAVCRLGIGPSSGQLIHLLVIALLEIDDRPVARPADHDHREAIGRGVRQGDQPVQETGGGDRHANARLLRQIPGDRGRVPSRLLVAEAEVADPFRLRQAQQIGDRDAGHPIDRVDPVQLEGLHHQVKAVGHIPRHILCSHIVPSLARAHPVVLSQ